MTQINEEKPRHRKSRSLLSRWALPAVVGAMAGTVPLAAAGGLYVVLSNRSSTATLDEAKRKADDAFKIEIGKLTEQIEGTKKREAELLQKLQQLMAKPPADDAGKKLLADELKKMGEELAALKTKNDELTAARKKAETEQAEQLANPKPLPVPTPVQQPPMNPVVIDEPKPADLGKGTAAGAGEKTSGKEDGGGVPPAALGAALIAAGLLFPELLPVLAALGLDLGGSLLGTEHKDGVRTVHAVRSIFEEGAEIKIEAALNKLSIESWGDPTEGIARLKKAIGHPEMRKKLGAAKADAMLAKLDELKTVYDMHGALLAAVGRDATLRLIRELPAILKAAPAEQAAMKAKFKTLLIPFPGTACQAEVWKTQLAGYIHAAASGVALESGPAGFKPCTITISPYVQSLLDLLKDKPKDGGKPVEQT